MPTEDKNQKELMKPIGFDDRTEGVMVGSEERKYEKRFNENIWGWKMRNKLGTLNSAEREKFFKEAPNIVSRLKEETQRFKDARYVIREILGIEEWKKRDEKNIYEIFELFVLADFDDQLWKENNAFRGLKDSGLKFWQLECFISQLTGEGWIETERDEFVSEDLRLRKRIRGQWVDNPRAEIRSYQIENEDKKHELLHFSHYKQIPYERIIEAFEQQQKRIEAIIKLHLKYLIPIEDSEKNNVPFNIKSILDESSEYKRSSDTWSTSESEPSLASAFNIAFERTNERMIKALESLTKLDLKYLNPIEAPGKNHVPFGIDPLPGDLSEYGRSDVPYPFPHYIFQSRNPPRSICQKKHSGECQMDGFRKMEGSLSYISKDLPKELLIPVCGEITRNEVLFLRSYMDCIKSDGVPAFGRMETPFLFLCCQNLLDIPFLLLLDHPNNYENGESIPGFDLKMKLPHIDVEVLREYFQEPKLKERVYALIKGDGWTPYIRSFDYQGNPKTEWLEFKKVPNSVSYGQFTNQQEKLEVTKRKKKKREC